MGSVTRDTAGPTLQTLQDGKYFFIMIRHHVILSLLVVGGVSPLSLLPQNLMVEAGNAKVPVYYNALSLLRSTVLDTSIYNINITTAILVVLFNVMLAFFIGKILNDVGRSRKFDESDWTSLGCFISNEEDRLSCLVRSACESPDRAMTILETAGQISGGRRSSKYDPMLQNLRRAAMAGYEGLDCSQL